MAEERIGLPCPTCGASTGVKDSRPLAALGGAIRRRRSCTRGHRFTTYEIVMPEKGVVIRPGNQGHVGTAFPLADLEARILGALTEGISNLVRRAVL